MIDDLHEKRNYRKSQSTSFLLENENDNNKREVKLNH